MTGGDFGSLHQVRSQGMGSGVSTRGKITRALRHLAFSTDDIYMAEPSRTKILATRMPYVDIYRSFVHSCVLEPNFLRLITRRLSRNDTMTNFTLANFTNQTLAIFFLKCIHYLYFSCYRQNKLFFDNRPKVTPVHSIEYCGKWHYSEMNLLYENTTR